MKIILYIILLLSVTFTQTNVAGVVSGTWDSDGSPYLVIGDVIITESLSIEEGVANLLNNIDYWHEAPVWTPDNIAVATRDWFRYLGDS